MNITNSKEDYLNAIYVLSNGENPVRITDISNFLNVRKSSTCAAVNDLKSDNLINYEKYKNVTLTENGLARAKHINKRQELFKRFLVEIVKTDEHLAGDEANNLAHCISCHTTAKLEKFIEKILEGDN